MPEATQLGIPELGLELTPLASTSTGQGLGFFDQCWRTGLRWGQMQSRPTLTSPRLTQPPPLYKADTGSPSCAQTHGPPPAQTSLPPLGHSPLLPSAGFSEWDVDRGLPPHSRVWERGPGAGVGLELPAAS